MKKGPIALPTPKHRWRTRSVSALGMMVFASYTLALQGLSLTTLKSLDYGHFSVVYLVFAWGASLNLSLVSEPAAINGFAGLSHDKLRSYSAAAATISISIGLLAGCVALILSWQIPIACLAAVAIACTLFRQSIRYCAVGTDNHKAMLYPECLAVPVLLAVWLVAHEASLDPLACVVGAWAAASLCTMAWTCLPPTLRPSQAQRWMRSNAPVISRLLKDSILMDLGAIGTPMILSPFMGLASLGLYRAVSNVAAPVRLVMAPLRPNIAMAQLARLLSLRTTALVFGSALLAGLSATILLLSAEKLPLSLGVFSELSPLAVPCGIFVTGNAVCTFYFLLVRLHGRGRMLHAGRISQTIVAVLAPSLGLLWADLQGAVWGLVIGTLLASAIWALLALRESRNAFAAKELEFEGRNL